MVIVATANHAAEGGHWYSRDRKQVLTVEGAKGQQVKPDLRHARKLDLAPGVTTIIRAADKPALTVYRERQVLLAALTLPRRDGETDADYIDRVMADAKEHARKAAEKGTEIHAQVESHFLGQVPTPIAAAAAAELARLIGTPGAPWQAETCVVSSAGYGTKADLHLPAGLFAASPWVVDIKTKDGDLDDPFVSDEHAQQLAATRMALAESIDVGYAAARCAILFVSRTETIASAIEIPEADVIRGGKCFHHLLAYWQEKNRYRPSWARTAAA